MRHPSLPDPAPRRPSRQAGLTVCALVLALGLSLTGAPLAYPQAGGADRRFGESTDVVLVQIPIYVTRKGEPVRGLTEKNFEVLEGKKKLDIVAVDVFDLEMLDATADGAGLAPAFAVPPAGRRNFVMLFDLSNSVPAGLVRAREAALDLARKGLHPSDLVAVATYRKDKGIEILMSFSTDRAQLEAALDDLGLVDPFNTFADPLRLMIAEIKQDRSDASAGNKGFADGVLLEALQDLSTLSGRANRDQVKQQIFDLSDNMNELARLLDSASGRKQVVLFSEGFDSEIVFGTSDTQKIAEAVENATYGKLWRVDSEERFGASDAQSSLLQMLDQFNRSDCAVHTVDTSGLTAGGDAGTSRVNGENFGGPGRLDRGHDGLALMANETGGEFYRNLNDLTVAMDDLLERTSVTYVLSIAPRDLAMDGSYHEIKVRLKGVDKGIELSHRPGYYARKPYWELDPTERQMLTAEQLVAGSPGGRIGTELLAAAFPGSASAAYVLTAVEVDGGTLVADQPDNMVPTEIYTYAFDENGQIRDFFSQAVVLDLYKVGYRLDTGFKLLSHLELPPGRYEIRSMVRNARTGASGLAVSQVTVPSFDGSEPFLLPPFFIEPDDHWLVGLEERDERTAPYPLMGRDKPMVPATHPRLAADQQIPMLLVGHELPASLEVEGHLIGSDGKVNDAIDIEVERRIDDRGEGERVMTRLVTGPVKPGDYRLIITVKGDDGTETSSSVPVRFLGAS